jgi:putative tryptophan/tyrosine transport system substrate-binding protein
MRRRDFIKGIAGSAAAWPLVARATDRPPRIGVLMGYPEGDLEAQSYIAAFREGLRTLGWTEGRDILIDIRWATPGDVESMQRFAKELVALRPDVILYSFANYAHDGRAAATNTNHPYRFRARFRSGRQRVRRESDQPRG